MLKIRYQTQPEALASANLLSALPSGVITVTREGVIRYANAAAEGFLWASLPALRGHELAHFIYPASQLLALIETAFSKKTLIREHDFVLSLPRAGSRNVSLQIQPSENEEEAIIVIDDRGMAGTLEQHTQHQVSTRQAGNMAAILAHEVKNPLSGIRGAAQLLQKTISPDDQALTQLICNEVDRIRNLLDEIEIFTDYSSLKPEPVNIHEVLQYVRLLAEKGFAAQVKFKERYDPSLPEIAGHRNLLIQLFVNLFKNAAQAMQGSDNATITLTTAYQSGLSVKAGEKSRALPILVTVEDNGPGISPELQESIFDPFVTTREGGKGLGLAIVAKIMADHGGVIEIDKETGPGARFRLLLPAA